MFSDTLFGHTKGAFTGAESVRKGLIEQASGGTLFLDEIGDLNMEPQRKLLRLLQAGEYSHLGEDASKTSDIRTVVATNRTIESLMGDGNFRRDLYFCLQTHHIHLPPLRERKGDIPLLVSYFLKQAAEALEKKYPPLHRYSLRCLGPTTYRETSETFTAWCRIPSVATKAAYFR